ncbi:hypothetical protein QOT17_016365 [Balamuthia mandrillaris]
MLPDRVSMLSSFQIHRLGNTLNVNMAAPPRITRPSTYPHQPSEGGDDFFLCPDQLSSLPPASFFQSSSTRWTLFKATETEEEQGAVAEDTVEEQGEDGSESGWIHVHRCCPDFNLYPLVQTTVLEVEDVTEEAGEERITTNKGTNTAGSLLYSSYLMGDLLFWPPLGSGFIYAKPERKRVNNAEDSHHGKKKNKGDPQDRA